MIKPAKLYLSYTMATLTHASVDPMLITHRRDKLIQAIIYFAGNTQACGKIKLFKLLYLLDFEHFRATGRSVTGSDYHAWKMGPVPIRLIQEWDELEPDMAAALSIQPERVYDYTRETVVPNAPFNAANFTKRELRIMEGLAEKYRDTLSEKMIDVTHAQNGAWTRVWDEGRGLDRSIDYSLSLEEGPHKEAILNAAKEHAAIGHHLGEHA